MKNKKWMALVAMMISATMLFTACGAKQEEAAPAASAAEEAEEEVEEEAEGAASEAAEEAVSEAEEAASEAAEEAGDASAALDLNSMTLDEIIAKAQEEGDVQSVGMPDEWAD